MLPAPARDLEDAAQTYPDAIWPGQIADALRGLIHAANLARDQGLGTVPAEMTAEHLTLFRRGVAVGLSRSAASPAPRASSRPPGRCWNACGTAKPTCCGSSPTPPSPRPATRPNATCGPRKTQQKISGRLRSEKTTRDRYAIRGYASTAAKHGIAVFTAIRDALAGNPWMPPIPASA